MENYYKPLESKEEFQKYIIEQIKKIEELNLPKDQRAQFYELVGQTISRNYIQEKWNDKENLEILIGNLENILEGSNEISKNFKKIKSGINILYEVHKKSKDSLLKNNLN